MSVTDSDISGGTHANLTVDNNGRGRWTPPWTRSTSDRSTPRHGDDAVRFNGVANTATTMDVVVNGATFTSAAGDIFQWVADGTGGGDLVFTNNTVSNNNPAIVNGGGGVTLTGGARAAATLNVDGNSFRDSHTSALTINKSRDNTAGAGSLDRNDQQQRHRRGRRRELRLTRRRGHRGHATGESNYNLTAHEQRDPPVQQLRHVVAHRGGGIAEYGDLQPEHLAATRSRTRAPTEPSPCSSGIGVNSGDRRPADTFQTCVDFGANSHHRLGDAADKDFRLRRGRTRPSGCPATPAAATTPAADTDRADFVGRARSAAARRAPALTAPTAAR